MYIHSYQIHNVLNEYRKQLSRGPVDGNGKRPPEALMRDRVELSGNGRSQAIIDQVSNEIAARMKDAGSKQDGRIETGNGNGPVGRESEFTYTLIDEFNRKRTNTLAIEDLSVSLGRKVPREQMSVNHQNGFITSQEERLGMTE